MEYVFYAVSILALILHFVAPLTKTPYDDVAADVADKVKEAIDPSKK